MPTQSSQQPNSNNDKRHACSDGTGRPCQDCQRQYKYTADKARNDLPVDDAVSAIEKTVLDGVEAMMLADRICEAQLFRTYAGQALTPARFFDVFEGFAEN